MRRHSERLQAVATSGLDGKVIRTAPQWHEPPLVTGGFPAPMFCRELSANRAHMDSVRVTLRLGKLVLFAAAAVAEVSRVGT